MFYFIKSKLMTLRQAQGEGRKVPSKQSIDGIKRERELSAAFTSEFIELSGRTGKENRS
jgi:hypothetical protein